MGLGFEILWVRLPYLQLMLTSRVVHGEPSASQKLVSGTTFSTRRPVGRVYRVRLNILENGPMVNIESRGIVTHRPHLPVNAPLALECLIKEGGPHCGGFPVSPIIEQLLSLSRNPNLCDVHPLS